MPSPTFKNAFNSGLLASFFVLGVSNAAQAATFTWIGPSGGSWTNRANWLPAGIPGASDSVIIGGQKKVSVPASATIANLTIGSGAEVANSGQLRVTGRTNSAGMFTGLGTVDIPSGASALFNIGFGTTTLAATRNAPRRVVRNALVVDKAFQPIKNNGTIIANIGAGSRVSFAKIENSGLTQIQSEGAVTFDDIKNVRQMEVELSGTAQLKKIENNGGGMLTLSSGAPAMAAPRAGIARALSDLAPIQLEDVLNGSGSKTRILGAKGARAFQTKAIKNSGVLEIEGAHARVDADFVNERDSKLILGGDAHLSSIDDTQKKLENVGTITKKAGSDATVNLEWINKGRVIVEDGTLHLQIPSGKECKQSEGITTLKGGTLIVQKEGSTSSNGTLTFDGGILDGSGTIAGNVVNRGGRVKAGFSPGSITINGNFTQSSSGALDMELGGTTASAYDQIIINGTAVLAGSLNLSRWNNYVPKSGDTFQLLTYYFKSGNFSNVVDLSPLRGVTYKPTATPTHFLATAQVVLPPDTLAPNVAIISPVPNSVLRSVAFANGTAVDAGSVASVTGRLYRYANTTTGLGAAFWAGGTTWTSSYGPNNERPATGTSDWNLSLPFLQNGRYTLRMTATDGAGNRAITTTTVFSVDNTAPTMAITTPISGRTLSGLSSVSGTVMDSAGGSGIDFVTVQIRRGFDGAYWNGSAWIFGAVNLSTLINGTTWARTGGMPTGFNFVAGSYTVTALAKDKAGNTRTVESFYNLPNSVSSHPSFNGS